MPRPSNFSVEEIEDIINKYLEIPRYGQITVKELVDFAKIKFGYEISYQDFTRKKKYKEVDDENGKKKWINFNEYLDELNTFNKQAVPKDIFIMSPFNPDAIYKDNKNDEKKLLIIFRQYADRHNELQDKYKEMFDKEMELKKQINDLKNEIIYLKEKLNIEKDAIKVKSEEIRKLRRFKELDVQINMREYLHGKALFTKMDEENLSILLKQCSLTGKHELVDEEVYLTEDYDAGVSEEEYRNDYVNNNENEKDDEDDDDDEIIAEIQAEKNKVIKLDAMQQKKKSLSDKWSDLV